MSTKQDTTLLNTPPLSKRGKPPLVSTLRRKKLIAFGWYGGKFSHLDWLLPLLPPAHHYCEPFARNEPFTPRRTSAARRCGRITIRARL